MALERLQKILAASGIASRRKAEALILQGLVTVNGRVVTRLGARADPERDDIRVRGRRIRLPKSHLYFLLYKPRGVITALSDPEGRPTVRDLLKGIRQRVYPVGRLDYDSEGVLLLTDDGELAHALMHPSFKVEKGYRVKIKGVLDERARARLERGMVIEGERMGPLRIRKIRRRVRNSWIEVVLTEGKKRQIRRMLQRVGHPVIRLIRTRYAFLTLKGLAPGEYRPLTPEEIRALRALVGLGKKPRRPPAVGQEGV